MNYTEKEKQRLGWALTVEQMEIISTELFLAGYEFGIKEGIAQIGKVKIDKKEIMRKIENILGREF